MLVKLFLVLITLGFSSAQTCRAVALEGGGSRGAYESGVLYALASTPSAGNVQYNVVSGISAGAMNTGVVAQYPMGTELQMSIALMGFWKNMTNNSDIFVPWDGGLVSGILFHSGIYNNAPAIELGRKVYSGPLLRNMTVGSTNLDTGLFGTFNESVGRAYIDAVTCSASPPFFFSPHQFEGYSWADGGCITNLDVFSAITRCLEVAPENGITVDMVYDNPYAGLGNETTFKTPEVLSRVFDIRGYDGSIWYTYNAKQAFPLVNYRYVLVPTKPIPGGIVPLNFTPEVLDYEIQLGINDTLALLNSSKTGAEIIDQLYQENKRRIIYP